MNAQITSFTQSSQPMTAVVLDYYLSMGVALDQLARALFENHNMELRLKNGLIEIWHGSELVRRYGTRDVELTADDWQRVAAKIAGGGA